MRPSGLVAVNAELCAINCSRRRSTRAFAIAGCARGRPGQPFMAFASVRREDLRWTRGRPSTFLSSNVAERNFCSACGTPLTYHRVESGSIAVTIGSLDAPEAVRPIEQFGIESELFWISGLRALPAKRTEDWKREYRIPHIDSHQYSA